MITVNEESTVLVCVWDAITSRYITLNFDRDLHVFDHYAMQSKWRYVDLFTQLPEAPTTYLAGLVHGKSFDEALGVYKKNVASALVENYVEGHVFYLTAWRMKDGSIIKPSSIGHCYAGTDDTLSILDYELRWERNFVPANPAEGEEAYIGHVIRDTQFSKVRIAINVDMTEQQLVDFGSVVEGLVVYCTAPISRYIISDNENDYNFKESLALDETEITPFKIKEIKPEFKNAFFYLVKEIPIDELKQNAIVTGDGKVYNFEVEFKQIQTKPVLNPDSLTLHTVFSNTNFLYNDRWHRGDIQTRLFGGYNALMNIVEGRNDGDISIAAIESNITLVETGASAFQRTVNPAYTNRIKNPNGSFASDGLSYTVETGGEIEFSITLGDRLYAATVMAYVLYVNGTQRDPHIDITPELFHTPRVKKYTIDVAPGDVVTWALVVDSIEDPGSPGTHVIDFRLIPEETFLYVAPAGQFKYNDYTALTNFIKNTSSDFESGDTLIIDPLLEMLTEPSIRIEVDIRYVDGKYTVISNYLEGSKFILNGTDEIRLLEPVFTYPHPNAVEARIFVLDDTTWRLAYTIPLKPHNLGFSYYLETVDEIPQVKVLFPVDINTYTARELSATNIVVHNPNRVQLSERFNPVYFPASNSYYLEDRDNIIMAFNVQAEAVSEGQFGSYPMFVFGRSYIHAMEVDLSGVTVYRSVQPIKQIGTTKQITLGLGAGIVFFAADGIYLLNGRNPQRISDPIGIYKDYAEYIPYRTIQGYTNEVVNNLDSLMADITPDSIEAIFHDIKYNELVFWSKSVFNLVYNYKLNMWYGKKANVPVMTYTDGEVKKFGGLYNWGAVVSEVSEITPINYGLLYNYPTVIDERLICADGWEVPSIADFETLNTYLGETETGLKLKESGFTHWDSDDNEGNNLSGFNGRGSGNRFDGFYDLKASGVFWTIDEVDSSTAYQKSLFYNLSTFGGGENNKIIGFSIRPIKTTTSLTHGQTGTYTGNDGKVYRTICIGTQEWLADNLAETKFRDDSWIYGFEDGIYTPISDEIWDALTTAACCAYNDDTDNI